MGTFSNSLVDARSAGQDKAQVEVRISGVRKLNAGEGIDAYSAFVRADFADLKLPGLDNPNFFISGPMITGELNLAQLEILADHPRVERISEPLLVGAIQSSQ